MVISSAEGGSFRSNLLDSKGLAKKATAATTAKTEKKGK